jgi:hypothetical protein
MQEMQPPTLQSAIDCARPNPQRRNLPARDDAMLPDRQRCNLAVDRTRSRFTPYIDVNLNRVGHGAILAREPLRGAR